MNELQVGVLTAIALTFYVWKTWGLLTLKLKVGTNDSNIVTDASLGC